MTNWKEYGFSELFENITSSSHKLKQSEYSTKGRYPVVDQGSEFIAGWSDKGSLVHPVRPPVIVYGDHTRAVKLVTRPFIQGADGVKVLAPTERITARFGAWLLRAFPVASRGYARHFSHLRKRRFRVPSLQEQDRITTAIETHVSRLDAATSSMARTTRNLERARQSVLKAAVEGRLVPTEADLARNEGRDYEPADVLLKRILEERRTLHEKEQEGTDQRKKYREPAKPETGGLPELPEGWVWTSMDALTEVSGGLTKNSKNQGQEHTLPYLRVANVYANELRLEDVSEIGVSEAQLERVLLEKNDLLIVEGNGSANQIGRVAVWGSAIEPCVHQNHLIKARPLSSVHPHWLLWWMLSPAGRRAIRGVASSTSGLYTLSLSKVCRLPAPLPPLREQQRVVAEIERNLSLLDAIGATVETNLTRCGRLRQAMLKAAFEGQLVSPENGTPTPSEPIDTPELAIT